MVTSNARESQALAYLRPALDEAVAKGRPVSADWVPTSLTSRELVSLAVRLCSDAGARAAVLANPLRNGVTFTPLL